jgi:hypothetical protein
VVTISLFAAGSGFDLAFHFHSKRAVLWLISWLGLAAVLSLPSLGRRRVWITLAVVGVLLSVVNRYRVVRAAAYFGKRVPEQAQRRLLR